MKILDRALGAMGWVKKESPGVWATGWVGDEPSSKFIDFTSYLEAGKKIDIVAKCCAIISDAVVSVKCWIMDDQDRVIDNPNDPINKLFANPNPSQTWREIKGLIVQHLLLTGNAYLVKEKGENSSQKSAIRELILLLPNRVSVVKSESGFVSGYVFKANANAREIPYRPDEMIHFKLPNPADQYYGLGKIEQGEVIYNLDGAAKKSGWKFFENGAVFSATLETDSAMADDAKARLKADIGDKNVGWFKWHKFLILDRGLKLKPAQATNRDMEYLGLLKFTRETILSIFGVPPAKAGVLENANYSNSEEQDQTFRSETVTPLLKLIDDKLTAGLVKEFNPRWRYESEDIVKDDEDQKSQIAARYFSVGALSPDEIREDYLGLERLNTPASSTTYLPLGVVPIGEMAEGEDIEEAEVRAIGFPAIIKSLPASEIKATSGRVRILMASRRIRSTVGQSMERELRSYFSEQEKRIITYIERTFDRSSGRRAFGVADVKAPVSGYSWREDNELIERRSKKYYDRTVGATVDILGQMTGTKVPDDAPALAGPKARLAMRIKRINETTRRELDDQIRLGIDRQYSLEQIVGGVEEDDFKGVRGTFKQARESRARMIARTEMASAFDQAAVVTYKEIGLQTLDVIGCEDNEIMPGETYGCNSVNIPIEQAASVNFHPNHTGTFVPSR